MGSLYASIINSNVLCNLFHELGYIFTLLAVKNLETKTNIDCFNSNTIYFKSSDDCHYFASKTIQHLVQILTYLEKPIINLILKQKIINIYTPELSKNLECKSNATVSKYTFNNYKKCIQILKTNNFFMFFYRIQLMILSFLIQI